jgi:hypothetical protein
MEHRFELQDILLRGLPEQERQHVVRVMEQVTADKRRHLQSRDTPDNGTINLVDSEPEEDPTY